MAAPVKAIASGLKDGTEQPMVRVRGLNQSFGKGENRKKVLDNNNITLMPGELVIMTGPSGSGKTTILTLIGALRTVQEGSVEVMGQELSGLNSHQLTEVRRGIGFIFQAHNLFDSLTAFQNVKMALELRTYTQAQMKKLAEEMLTRLGLGHRIHYKPRALSGGQKQRVAVARALVNRPKLILADEPTAALDKVSGREVVTMFKELAKGERCTILMVTHDNRILDAADRIVNMVDGRIASEILVEEAVTICAFLIKCPVFEKNSPAELTEISQKMLKEHYTPGTTIIRQGDEGDKFFLIRDGTVDVLAKEGEAAPRKVATLEAGDFFGEAALITGQPRNATVVARDDVVLYELKKDDFLAALNASASFNEQLRDVFFKRAR
jgi:putative ABC transport system ATP-binding protein